MTAIIEVSELSKSFEKVTALDHVSFSVEQGTIFGLLGPNGAGKTTIVRLLNGVLKPNNGTATVFGKDIRTDGSEIRKSTGVQTDTNLYEKLTALENLEIWGKLYGLSGMQASKRAGELLEEFGLSGRSGDLVGTFSKGMKQKLSIARALVHEPEILFLDEPTAGLDPEASSELLDFLKKIVQTKKRTVFLCSHRLEEVEQVCSDVAIINRGKVLEKGRVLELEKKFWKKISFVIRGKGLEKLPPGFLASVNGRIANGNLNVQVEKPEAISKIIEALVRSKVQVLEVTEEKHSLKDVYFKIMDGAKK